MKKNSSDDFFGKRLRSYRKGKKLTGQQFAALIGISQGNLSEIETGRVKPSLDTIVKIASKTDADLTWLILGNSSEPKFQKKFLTDNDLPAFLYELAEWGREISDSKRLDWLENQLEACLPTWQIWREKKKDEDRAALHTNQIDEKKVA